MLASFARRVGPRFAAGSGPRVRTGCGIAAASVGVALGSSAASAQSFSDAITESQSQLQQELRLLGISDAEAKVFCSRVTFSVKGERVSARTLIAQPRILRSLVPLVQAFPLVQCTADASVAGESLVLRDSAPHSGDSAPILSIFVGNNALAELEVLGGRMTSEDEVGDGPSLRPLGQKETRALAHAMVAASRHDGGDSTADDSERSTSPRAGFRGPGGLLGELFSGAFRDLDEQRAGGGGMGGGGGAPRGMPGKANGAGSSPVERLQAMGIRVILPHEASQQGEPGTPGTPGTPEAGGGTAGGGTAGGHGWDALAGSDAVRSALDESLLLPLLHPEVYREVMQGTRRDAAVHPHAKAVLFEGPPGCGKTSAARILAKQLGRPFVSLPLESVVSKWYGEAEQKLAACFDACAEMGPTIIFLDEIDALATSRDGETTREATLTQDRRSDRVTSAHGRAVPPRSHARAMTRLARALTRLPSPPRSARWYARGHPSLPLGPPAPPRWIRCKHIHSPHRGHQSAEGPRRRTGLAL